MSYRSKISIVKNIFHAPMNFWKDPTKFKIEQFKKIKLKEKIDFSSRQIEKYHQIIHWDHLELSPTFPYTLMTHLQFTLVNHRDFPFPPFGLIHKSESIEILEQLTIGKWEMTCSLEKIERVERGYEVELMSELLINGKVVWRSKTLALKKMKGKVKRKSREPVNGQGTIFWNIPADQGFRYGLLSENIDPIHLSSLTARLMGFRKAIIHGMWTLGRGMAELGHLQYPMNINVKFISPIQLPAKVMFEKNQQGFSVYSADGKKIHLSVILGS